MMMTIETMAIVLARKHGAEDGRDTATIWCSGYASKRRTRPNNGAWKVVGYNEDMSPQYAIEFEDLYPEAILPKMKGATDIILEKCDLYEDGWLILPYGEDDAGQEEVQEFADKLLEQYTLAFGTAVAEVCANERQRRLG